MESLISGVLPGKGKKGIHHYYTLHRLSVQIEDPSRRSV